MLGHFAVCCREITEGVRDFYWQYRWKKYLSSPTLIEIPQMMKWSWKLNKRMLLNFTLDSWTVFLYLKNKLRLGGVLVAWTMGCSPSWLALYIWALAYFSSPTVSCTQFLSSWFLWPQAPAASSFLFMLLHAGTPKAQLTQMPLFSMAASVWYATKNRTYIYFICF